MPENLDTPPKDPPKEITDATDQKGLYDFLGRAMDEYQKSAKREEEIMTKHEPALQAARQSEMDEIRRQQENPPTLPTAPTAPPVPQRKDYIDPTVSKSLFAVASLMAGLAMAGGRGRGMLAMAGMRGALEGYNQNNQEKYQAGLNSYKLQVDEQAKAYDEQYKSYMAILQSNKLSLEERMQAYSLESSQMQDEIGVELARQKNLDGMIKHAEDIQKFSAEAKKAASDAELMPYKVKIAQANEQAAEARAKAAAQRATQKAADTKQVEHLKGAIQTAQKTLDQLQKDEKAVGGGFSAVGEFFGYKNERHQQILDDIEKQKAHIAEMQKTMDSLVLGQKVQDAVSGGQDIDVGLPLD